MTIQWLADRLRGGAKGKKSSKGGNARPSGRSRRVQFEHLENRALLSASPFGMPGAAVAAGKLMGPPLAGPPTGGSTGGSVTKPVLSTAAAATLSVHVLPPAPLPGGPQGPGGPGGNNGGTGSTSSTPNVITGSMITVQVCALDANGVPTTNYNGTATVTCSDSSVTVPASLTFVNGVATFQVTVSAIGSDTFTVTDKTTATITGSTTINVVAAPAATQYGICVLPPPPPGSGSNGGTTGNTSKPLPPPPPPGPPPAGTTPSIKAGTTVTVQVVALDANGHPVPNYTGTATVASSDTSVTVPTSITFVNGVATLQVTLSTVESETLTVTSSDGTITGKTTVSVVAASSSTTTSATGSALRLH